MPSTRGSTQKAEAGRPDWPAPEDLDLKMEKGRKEEAGRGHSEVEKVPRRKPAVQGQSKVPKVKLTMARKQFQESYTVAILYSYAHVGHLNQIDCSLSSLPLYRGKRNPVSTL